MNSSLVRDLVVQGRISEDMCEPMMLPAAFERFLRREPEKAVHFLRDLVAMGELPSVDVLLGSEVLQRAISDAETSAKLKSPVESLITSIAIAGTLDQEPVMSALTDNWLFALRDAKLSMALSLAGVLSKAKGNHASRALSKLVHVGVDPNQVVMARTSHITKHSEKWYGDVTAAGWIADNYPQMLPALYPSRLQSMPMVATVQGEPDQRYHKRAEGDRVPLIEFMLDGLSQDILSIDENVRTVAAVVNIFDTTNPGMRHSLGDAIDRMMGGDAFYHAKALRVATVALLPYADFDDEQSFALRGSQGENVMHFAVRYAEHIDLPRILENMKQWLPQLNVPTTGQGCEAPINTDLLSEAILMSDLQAFSALLDAGFSLDDNNESPRRALSVLVREHRAEFEAFVSARQARQAIEGSASLAGNIRPL